MDKKKMLIIGVILLVIVGVIFIMLTYVNYEKIYITPNGTSIDVPSDVTKYRGSVEGLKIWNWDKGVLVTYNNHEDNNVLKLSGLTFNSMTDLIKKVGTIQEIDGYTCYKLTADDLVNIKLFDFLSVKTGTIYCICLNNETTQDNIIICCNDKDVALHMAKSVEYKKVYQDTSQNTINSTINNISDNIKSKASDLLNSGDNIKSKASDIISGDNLKSKASDIISSGDNIKSKASDVISSSDIDQYKAKLEQLKLNI